MACDRKGIGKRAVCPRDLSALSERSLGLHEGAPNPVGLAAELQEASVVHDVVDYRGGHLLVAEDRAPPRKLE